MWKKKSFRPAGIQMSSDFLGAISVNHVTSNSLSFFRELGIGIVAYSPLGRGFFASGPKLVENLEKNDFRKAST